jgi:hypothetical protein
MRYPSCKPRQAYKSNQKFVRRNLESRREMYGCDSSQAYLELELNCP